MGFGCVVLAALVMVGTPAHAQEQAAGYDVQGTVDASGALHLTETITFDSAPATLTQRIATTADGPDDHTSYTFEVSGVAATVAGTPTEPILTPDADGVAITLDTAGAGIGPVTISYTVTGASRAGAVVPGRQQLTTVSWPVLQGLSVPVLRASGTVQLPASIAGIECRSGPASALGPCLMWAGGTHDAPDPSFEDADRAAGDQIVLSIQVPASAVAPDQVVVEHWTLDRAFTASGWPLLAALLVLLLGAGALALLYRRSGADRVGALRPTEVARFVPVGPGQTEFRLLVDIRPGEVGTLTDEHVDPVDVTATILDLAVRGHLRITELARTGGHQPPDWVLERRPGQDTLRPYERTLLDAVAPEGADPVPVSRIGSAVGSCIATVQDQLYDEVVGHGWFQTRPDAVRTIWTRLGWGCLVASLLVAGVLIALTRFGLAGLALVIGSVGVIYLARHMPRRTELGASVLSGLGMLASQLATAPTDQLPAGREFEQLSAVLPYAQVLGGRERWLAAFPDADHDPDVPDAVDLVWYHGPDDWHLSDLPASVGAFAATLQGRLYDR